MKISLGAKTLAYPAPVWAIGTYDTEGKPNMMTAAWGGICCSAPPCVSVSLRKATYTYGNIIERKAFTVNIASEQFAQAVDYFGIISGREVDKFSATGLTPAHSDLVDAPYIQEFPVILECQLLQANEIGLHTQFIGEILDVKVEAALASDGVMPGMDRTKPFVYDTGTSSYYGIGRLLGKAFSLGRGEKK